MSDDPRVLAHITFDQDDLGDAEIMRRKLNRALESLTFRMIRRGGPELVETTEGWVLMSHRVGVS